MKRITLIFSAFVFFILLPPSASANFPPGITCKSPGANAYPIYWRVCVNGDDYNWTPPEPGTRFVNGMYYYVPYRDEYRVDYAPPDGVAWYQLHFTSPTNQVWTAEYYFPPTGIHYLTCNGTYVLNFFDENNNLIYQTQEMHTSQMINPTCLSYADGISGIEDFSVEYGSLNDGRYDLSWSDVPGASIYEVWLNGQLVDVTGSTHTIIHEKGSVSVVAKDGSGNIVGQTDTQVPSLSEEYQANLGCNICEKISQALQCPEWDTYMGELTQAIRNALPTLPEWRRIADQFVDAFAEYWGPVPNVPTKSQIENNIRPNMPVLDTSVPGSEMVPTVPNEFNTPLEFDITNAPEIPVVDESEPFEIYEPDQFIDADDPGEFVYPGDPRNHSDGIKNPDIVHTGYDTPVPAGSGGSPPEIDPPIPEPPPPDPDIPPSVMPEPAPTPPDMAIPTK